MSGTEERSARCCSSRRKRDFFALRARGASRLARLASRESILALINVAIVLGLAFLAPKAFISWTNTKAVLSLMTYDLLIAVGMTTVLILGGLDLSVGSVLALSSVIMALMMRSGLPVLPSLLAALAACVLCGLCNGLLIARWRILPFLVTLGMMSVARGIATVMTTGQYISFPNVADWFIVFGRQELPLWTQGGVRYGVPFGLLITLLISVAYAFLLRRWAPLRQMFFIGQNREAAKLAGLRVVSVTVAGYVICSAFVWLASVLIVAGNRIGYANYGTGAEMRAIAAAVLGGASMAGGAGSIPGTCLGVLMLALIGNGFVLLHGDPNWQQASTGIVLLAAVGLDALRRLGRVGAR